MTKKYRDGKCKECKSSYPRETRHVSVNGWCKKARCQEAKTAHQLETRRKASRNQGMTCKKLDRESQDMLKQEFNGRFCQFDNCGKPLTNSWFYCKDHHYIVSSKMVGLWDECLYH